MEVKSINEMDLPLDSVFKFDVFTENTFVFGRTYNIGESTYFEEVGLIKDGQEIDIFDTMVLKELTEFKNILYFSFRKWAISNQEDAYDNKSFVKEYYYRPLIIT